MAVGIITAPKKEDALDKIAKGLNIAVGVLGGIEGVQKIAKAGDMDAINKLLKTQEIQKTGLETEKLQRDAENAKSDASIDSPQAKAYQSALFAAAKGRGVNLDPESVSKMSPKDIKPIIGNLTFESPMEATLRQLTKQEKEKQLNKVTPQEFQAAQFGTRAQQAEEVFKKLKESGFDPTSVSSAVQRSSLFPNVLASSESQQNEQAKRNFLNAVLRRESGAAISAGEFESGNKQYFPVNGDSPEVLAQKEQNRQTVIDAMLTEGAPALSKIKGSSSQVQAKSKSSQSAIPSAQAAPSKPAKVIQNGHEYILNPKTGQYE